MGIFLGVGIEELAHLGPRVGRQYSGHVRRAAITPVKKFYTGISRFLPFGRGEAEKLGQHLVRWLASKRIIGFEIGKGLVIAVDTDVGPGTVSEVNRKVLVFT